MRILIATPAYGGLLTTGWFTSFLETLGEMPKHGHHISVLTVDRDALISRARNTSAMVALENKFDKVMFIDSDHIWKPEQLLMLLKSDKKIVGGTYPYKRMPLGLVFNAIPEHRDIWDIHDKSMDSYKRFCDKYAESNGEVEVHNLPTGFMLIDIEVLKTMANTRPRYVSSHMTADKTKDVVDFFPVGLVREIGKDTYKYNTEDWGFCDAAREAGFKIYLQTKCVVDHIGQHIYSVR